MCDRSPMTMPLFSSFAVWTIANYNDNANQKIHQWQFAEITKQLFYKAKEFGVKITKISERDTSKTCALCGRETNGRVHRGAV